MENNSVPLQIITLIDQMNDKNSDINIRGNFRSRLATISNVINTSIKKYDDEVALTRGVTKKRYVSR